jgi:hypothetical protein
MIAQGTNGLSLEMCLEGVVAGQDMLSFVDLAHTAIEYHPPIREFVELWLTPRWWG